MSGYQAWLPDSCLEDRNIAQLFASIVKLWCDNWFVSAKWSVADRWLKVAKSDEGAEKLIYAFELGGLSCHFSERGKPAIIEAMLDISLDKERRGKSDLRLFDCLSEKLLKDLQNRLLLLENAQGTAPPSSEYYAPVKARDYKLTISDKTKRAMIVLHADRQYLVQAASALAPPARSLGQVAARSEAIERTQVNVGARLGGASLPLSDIANLGLGDVIALDTAVGDHLGLTIDGVETARSAIAVLPQQENIVLQITRSLS